MGGFIVGFDSDMPSIFQRQIDFIQKSGIVTAMVGMLQAPPGTRLFDRLQRESRVVNTFNSIYVHQLTLEVPNNAWSDCDSTTRLGVATVTKRCLKIV